MSSSGIIRVPAEEYVIYYPPTDQSDSRITLNCSIKTDSTPDGDSPTSDLGPNLSIVIDLIVLISLSSQCVYLCW